MEGDQEKKRKSIGFSLSVADEKIKLIDILSDDDNDFLVASHLTIPDNEEKDYGHELKLSPLCVESSRPSLAWDAAFFNSSGVLDQHELSIINQGFKTIQESTSNTLKKVDRYSRSNKKNSRKEAPVFSPNPAKGALCRLRNSFMKPNKKDLPGKHDAKVEKTHSTPNSARFSYSSPRSCTVHLKRMAAQSRTSEISKIWRCSESTKVKNTSSLSTGFDSKTRFAREPIIMDYNDAKEAPDSLQETRDSFFSAAQSRPSGIRPPSPKIGFFDEKTLLFSHGEPKIRRNARQKVGPQGTPWDAKAQFRCSGTDTLADSACEKLKRNTKRTKGAHMNLSDATNIKETSSIKKKSEDVGRKFSKCDPFLSRENGKKKVRTDSGDQHGKLCRYFEAIDLKQDSQQPSSPSSNKTRTPLAERTPSICDYSNTNLVWFGTK